MNEKIIVALVIIITVQCYYLVSELRLTVRTTRGTNAAIDRGTMRLVWILVACCYITGWFPVIFDFGTLVVLGDWLTWAGVAIMIFGIVFRRNAISVLGKFFTSTVQIQKDHQLVMIGPYRYIRHPSYLGILIMTMGLGIALSNWISLILCIVLPVIGIIKRIQVEERELEQHFGTQYQDYRKHTWRIIPYIY
jgi:protein-S-isoprenylcysteine O-methyltransferase